MGFKLVINMGSMMNAIMEAWIKPWNLHNINPIAKLSLVNLGNLQLCKGLFMEFNSLLEH
jgi:hypothetical protein